MHFRNPVNPPIGVGINDLKRVAEQLKQSHSFAYISIQDDKTPGTIMMSLGQKKGKAFLYPNRFADLEGNANIVVGTFAKVQVIRDMLLKSAWFTDALGQGFSKDDQLEILYQTDGLMIMPPPSAATPRHRRTLGKC